MARTFHSNIVLCGIVAVFQAWAFTVSAYPIPQDVSGSLNRLAVNFENPQALYSISVEGQDFVPETTLDMIHQSAAIWSNVNQSYISLVSEETPDAITSENPPLIILKIVDKSQLIAGSAGFSQVESNSEDGVEVCAIYLYYSPALSNIAFGKTVLHELGHCLGLGHSLVPEAIMSYYNHKNEFELDIDDRAALSRLYPSNGDDPKLPNGCAIRHVKNEAHLITIYFVLLIPIFLVFLRKKICG